MNAPPGIPVLRLDSPFQGRVIERVVAEGATIAEIVAATPDLPAMFRQRGVVCVDGVEVPREMWALVRPRVRIGLRIPVTLHYPALQGGRGGAGGGARGGKNTMALVASIAVVVAAAAVSFGVFGPLGTFTLGAATITGAQLAGAAIAVGGSLAISALTPPPAFDQPELAAPPGGVAPGTAALTGNVLNPGGAVPRVLGTMRVYPPLGCHPLTEVVGDDEYVEGVFVLAGAHQISGLESDGLDVSTLEDFQTEISEGLPGSSKVALVQRYSRTDQPAIQLSNYTVDIAHGDTTVLASQSLPETCIPAWHRIVSRDAPDEIWIVLAWPEGLMVDDAPGVRRGCPLRIRMRRRGETTWINGPEIHFSHDTTAAFKKTIKLMFVPTPSVMPVPSIDDAPYLAYRSVPAQSVLSPSRPGWTADSYFSTGSGDAYLKADNVATSGVRNVALYSDRVELYLSGAQFPKDQWEIELIYGYCYNSAIFTTTTYQFNSKLHDLFGYYVNASNGNKLSPPGSTGRLHNTCIIQRVSSVINEHPVQSDDFAHIAVRVKNRSVGQFSALASGYVYDWSGTDWDELAVTSNPAAHYRDVLINQRLNARPLPQHLLDNDDLIAWRDMGYSVNAVCEGRAVADVLTLIAASGFARPRQSERWGVILDRDRSGDGVVQTFSPRNMRNFGWMKAFAHRPDGFRARFSDAADSYRENELIVLDPYSTADGGRYEDIRYDGLVTEDEVRARAELDLAQLRFRMAFYSGETNRQHLVCRAGDLVGVSYDRIQRNAGSAYVKTILTDGDGNVTGLELDGTFQTIEGTDAFLDEAGAFSSYAAAFSELRLGAAIRLRNQTSMVAEIEADGSDPRIVHFVTPFEDPGSSVLAPGSLVVIGPLGEEYRRMIVLSITPKSDITASLTFVDEAPQLFS